MEKQQEILFRGKPLKEYRKYMGEWIQGSLLESDVIVSKGATDVDDDYIGFSGEWCSVMPETVGQFIGRTDKNSVNIFAGDILSICLGKTIKIGVVEYDARISGWAVKYKNDQCSLFYDLFMGAKKDKRVCYEIIGNIHDNPELMEG